MKKLSLLLTLLLFSFYAYSQKGISYQAVILDPNKIEIPGQDITGQPLVNSEVWVKFNIYLGTTLQFEEIQKTNTDSYGLVNLVIGSEANSQFNAMIWDSNQKSLQVYVSFNKGNSYTKVSDQKLIYTPYALFSESAGKLSTTLGIVGGGTGATTAVTARSNLGLGNVDNTADADKSVSTATQAALNLKASLASPIFTGTVSGITKSMVGLDSVDNTTDAAKPVSSATQAALDLKLNVNGNAATASKLATAKKINGIDFDGTSDITITTTADASTLSGTVATAKGGTGLTTIGTAGQILTSTGSGTLTWTTSSGVPYSGATSSVNLGAFDLTVNGITIGNGSDSTNTVFGNEALLNNTIGNNNTAIGSKALHSNTIGEGNTANGFRALYSNTEGLGNTANGSYALHSNTTGEVNTANGNGALYSNETGRYNTANGASSLSNNLNGSQNTANGFSALSRNSSGENNTANGYNALSLNATGSNNTAIGSEANVLLENLTNTTAIGYQAKVNTSNSIQLGNTDVTNVKTSGMITAGTVTYPNTHGTNGQVLTTTGSGTLTFTSISASNVVDASTLSGTVSIAKGGTGATTASAARTNLGLVIGTNVQAPLTAGTDYLTPTGSAAGLTSFPTLNQNTTGNAATAALAGNITATSNSSLTELSNLTSVGTLITGTISLTTDIKTSGKLFAGTVAYPNTHGTTGQVLSTTGSGTLTWTNSSGVPYIGAAGPVNLGGYDLVVNSITIGAGGGNIYGNAALGLEALNSNSTGERNTAVGTASLYHNVDGNSNTSFGVASLYNNNSGSLNVAVGDGALYNNISGNGNTALGISSMYGISTGNENTAVGFNSVTNPWLVSVTGSHNTGVGTNSLNNVGSGSYNTAIGFSADIANEAFFNSTAIGNGALANASNTVQLGNTSVTKVQTSGALTTGSVTYPTTHGTNGQVLSTTGNGTLTWTTIVSSSQVDASTLSGTVSVTKGGTGTSTLSGLVLGNGSNAMSGLTGSVSGETITWNSTSSNWQLTGNSNLAIGNSAGRQGQGINAVAIGTDAGYWMQGANSIALGTAAGANYQNANSLALGNNAGNSSQGSNSIALGANAGNSAQNNYSIAIGSDAGVDSQGLSSIAMGNSAGAISQGISSIAIGEGAGAERQGNGSIAIGSTAGFYDQGANAIAIGKLAGHTIQTANSIVINASGTALTNNSIQGLFIKPVRSNNISGGSLLQYNTSTSEIYSSNKMTNATITDKVIVGSLSETAASAVLEANSTTKGFLPPRMTNTERNAISSPDEGLMIWNTTESELNVYNGSLWINMAGISNQTLAVGMKYQGGKIAYILQSGDPGYDSQIQHGIIAASSDQSNGALWSPTSSAIGTTINIGDGDLNTSKVINNIGSLSISNSAFSYAAAVAKRYRGGGYSDWYLPSKMELYLLFKNKDLIGGFNLSGINTDSWYWSSTEDDTQNAFIIPFAFSTNTSFNNLFFAEGKSFAFRVRAIRSF
ncbi:hypothetical protein U8591_10975 [Aquirufa antheringensis]